VYLYFEGHLEVKNCTKIYLCWGSSPDSAGGAYSAPSDPLARTRPAVALRASAHHLTPLEKNPAGAYGSERVCFHNLESKRNEVGGSASLKLVYNLRRTRAETFLSF